MYFIILIFKVNELRRFRVEAAKWQQQFESTQKLLQEQEEEMKLHRSKLRFLESEQLEDGGDSASKRTSTSSEPSTPSSNESYLEMVAKVSDLEQVLLLSFEAKIFQKHGL